MKHITTWSPDTCGCILEYEWDDSVPAEEREYSVSKIKRKCAAHAAEEAPSTHFDKVLGENSLKNSVTAQIKEVHADAEVEFEFDGQRNLVLHVDKVAEVASEVLDNLPPKVTVNIKGSS